MFWPYVYYCKIITIIKLMHIYYSPKLGFIFEFHWFSCLHTSFVFYSIVSWPIKLNVSFNFSEYQNLFERDINPMYSSHSFTKYVFNKDNWFLLFVVVWFYKITMNSELANTELLLLGNMYRHAYMHISHNIFLNHKIIYLHRVYFI